VLAGDVLNGHGLKATVPLQGLSISESKDFVKWLTNVWYLWYNLGLGGEVMEGKGEDELRLERQVVENKGHIPFYPMLRKLNLLRQYAMQRDCRKDAEGWCAGIIRLATAERMRTLPLARLQDASNILRDAYTLMGRDSFHHFLIAMEWNRPKEQRFYEPRMGVLRGVVQDMQRLRDGELSVYGLSMPPRVGKTTLGLFYIAWMAGNNPGKACLGITYAGGLAKSFYEGTREFLSSPEYRFADIFPESPLADTDAKYMSLDLESPRRYKSITFRSMDGTITGNVEATSLLYLDDLVSGIEEAMKPERLDILWSKVTADVLQRKKGNVPLFILGTRWSVHDPIGRIREQYEGKGAEGKVKFVTLPALDDDGESNFDYSYGVGFSTSHYEELKGTLDSVTWECVYMQHPIERDGLVFPEDALVRYLELPSAKPDRIVFATDVAFGGSDYLACPICYVYGTDCYITDVVFMNHADYKVTEPIVEGRIMRHKCQQGTFESNNGGDFYARDVMSLLRKDGYSCNITWERAPTNQSKMGRIVQFAPDIMRFRFKDKSLYKHDREYYAFMRNLTTFTSTGKSRNDDAPDACAMLARLLKIEHVSRPEFSDRRKLGI